VLSNPFWIEQAAAHRRAERDRAASTAALRAQVAVPGRSGRDPRSWPGFGTPARTPRVAAPHRGTGGALTQHGG
jgi:hypothetical protein